MSTCRLGQRCSLSKGPAIWRWHNIRTGNMISGIPPEPVLVVWLEVCEHKQSTLVTCLQVPFVMFNMNRPIRWRHPVGLCTVVDTQIGEIDVLNSPSAGYKAACKNCMFIFNNNILLIFPHLGCWNNHFYWMIPNLADCNPMQQVSSRLHTPTHTHTPPKYLTLFKEHVTEVMGAKGTMFVLLGIVGALCLLAPGLEAGDPVSVLSILKASKEAIESYDVERNMEIVHKHYFTTTKGMFSRKSYMTSSWHDVIISLWKNQSENCLTWTNRSPGNFGHGIKNSRMSDGNQGVFWKDVPGYSRSWLYGYCMPFDRDRLVVSKNEHLIYSQNTCLIMNFQYQ